MSGIISCTNCGLPIFHGAAGYAGAQCRCGFSAKPNYDHNALADLLKERDQLKAENERLHMQLTACGVIALANTPESAREARKMHPDYMSASCSDVANAVDREMKLRKQLDQTTEECEYLANENVEFKLMIFNLRKSLDEARGLLHVASEIIHEQAIHIDRPMTDLGSESLAKIDAWLEANK